MLIGEIVCPESRKEFNDKDFLNSMMIIMTGLIPDFLFGIYLVVIS